jgi:hypothetical protein
VKVYKPDRSEGTFEAWIYVVIERYGLSGFAK